MSGSTAGPDGPRWMPRRGPGFDVPAEASPPDYVQHSTFWGLDYGTGELVAVTPAEQLATLPDDPMTGGY